MRITPGARIAGHPALEIRRLLRCTRDGLNRRAVGPTLALVHADAQPLVAALLRLGYLSESPHSARYVQNTVLGNALANATATRGITRETADRLLKELLARARRVNRRAFAFAVARMWVFGSYLSDCAMLGDLDVIVELSPRDADLAKREARTLSRVSLARRAGRRLDTIGAELEWPLKEVVLFLKNHSAHISLHELEDLVVASSEKKLVFDDPRFPTAARGKETPPTG